MTSTARPWSYDPAGRLYQIAASATRRFLYDGAQAIAEYSGANALLRRYVPGASVDETLVWYEGSANLADKRWLLTDPRGSVVALTDDDGDADLDDGGPLGPAINKYDEYGNPASGFTGRFGFTGQMWISELQLWHYKARAYSPATGRFMQTDPILYAGGLNLYAYVDNDPANLTDPFGLEACVPSEDRVCVVGAPLTHPCLACDEPRNPGADQLFRDFAFASPFGGGGERGERGEREGEEDPSCANDPPIKFARDLARLGNVVGNASIDASVLLIEIGVVGAAAGAPFGLGVATLPIGSSINLASGTVLVATGDRRSGAIAVLDAAGGRILKNVPDELAPALDPALDDFYERVIDLIDSVDGNPGDIVDCE